MSHGIVNNFVESACWGDDVKRYKLNTMDTWHYTDIEVRLNKPQVNPTILPITVGNTTVPYCTSCSNLMINDLNKTITSWNKEEVKNIDTQLEKSMALRYLVHIIGDVHQPLHSAALFDDKLFPKGDMGGNFFYIKYAAKPAINQLHKFFDSGADALADFKRPLSKNDASELVDYAMDLIDEQVKKSVTPCSSLAK